MFHSLSYYLTSPRNFLLTSETKSSRYPFSLLFDKGLEKRSLVFSRLTTKANITYSTCHPHQITFFFPRIREGTLTHPLCSQDVANSRARNIRSLLVQTPSMMDV